MDHERHLPKPSAGATNTVLERLRPNVVVRRRVVTVSASHPVTSAPNERERVELAVKEEDEAPPSSIFAHPDYLLRAGTQESDPERDEDEDEASEEGEEPAHEALPEAPPPSLRPNVTVGPDATLASVAKELGLSPAELAADLMARGFFSVTPRTRLSDELIRVLAQVFHCKISRTSEPPRKPPARTKKKPVRPSPPAKRTAAKK